MKRELQILSYEEATKLRYKELSFKDPNFGDGEIKIKLTFILDREEGYGKSIIEYGIERTPQISLKYCQFIIEIYDNSHKPCDNFVLRDANDKEYKITSKIYEIISDDKK
jgi:hypothetical protein